jgi:hypothetical protein
MATRSNIIFADNGRPFVNIYRHWDGYPSSAGVEICEFLKSFTLVNGISEDKQTVANEIGCLAAWFLAKFKTEAGNYYIEKLRSDSHQTNAFGYVIDESKGEITLTIWEGETLLFQGNVEKCLEFCQTHEG